MFWLLTALLYGAIYVLIDIIRPKPKLENARPAGLGDFQFPTATEGREVPLVWGEAVLKGPNVVWYGDFRQGPRKKKVKTGMFSHQDVVIGYEYSVGMHLAICRGPVDELVSIRLGDRALTLGRVGTGVMNINAPEALGGQELGQGGIVANGTFYSGAETDTQNAYLQSQLGTDIPAFRGTCCYVFEGGYVGTSTSIPALAFVVRRIPDGLNLAAYSPGSELVNDHDANIANVIYEIMTDTEWGLQIPSSAINIPNFQAVGVMLAEEGNGFSMVLDRGMEAVELLQELERQADGLIYFDKTSAQWCIALARDNYDPDDLTLFDETNTAEVASFSRATWEETCNQVHVKYANREENYRDSYAIAQDIANYQIQNATIATEVVYPGVKDGPLANKLAWRDLRALSYPLAKAELILNRTAYALLPGSVFRFSNAKLSVVDMVMRVTRVDYGNLADGKVRVDCLQDIFAVTSGVFANPPSSGWGEPAEYPGVLELEDILAFEAPYQLVNQDTWRPSLEVRIWHGARNPGGGTTYLVPYYRTGATRPLTGAFAEDDQGVYAFCLAGTLESDIPAYYSTDARPAHQQIHVTNNAPDDLTTLIGNGSSADVSDLLNIVYIDGEFIGYEDVLGPTSDLRLDDLHRGLFHTAPKAHAAGTRVWFIGQTGGNLTGFDIPTGDIKVDTRLYGKNRRGLYVVEDPPIVETDLQSISRVPMAPRDPELNTVYAPASVSLDVNHATGTGLSGDDNRSIQVDIVPRYWRSTDVVVTEVNLLNVLQWLGDDPEFDYVLVLDPEGTPVFTPVLTVVATDGSPTAYLLRNAVIEALGPGVVIPDTAQLQVTARHTYNGTAYTNPVKMLHDFALTSGLQTAALIFGAIPVSTSSTGIVFNETGTYTFDIHYILPSSGIVEANVNGGGWATLIAAGLTTGTLAVTATDSIQLRFSVAPTADQFFDIVGPTAETGYGVLLS